MTQRRPTAHTLEKGERLDPPPQRQPILTLADWLRSPRHPDAPPVPAHMLGGAPIAGIRQADPLPRCCDDDR